MFFVSNLISGSKMPEFKPKKSIIEEEARMNQFKIIKGKFHVKGYQPDGDSNPLRGR
jgi:hypothetical protein